MSLSFSSYPLWLNLLLFAAASAVIWFAGTRLERQADTISQRTRLGEAFTGMLLLSAATSLPEVATTFTAVFFLHNPTLAVYNLMGGVALQTAILVVADRAKRKHGALTFFSPRFVLLVEGVGLVVLLLLTIAGATARGFPAVATVGLWPVLIFLTYLGVLYLTYRYRGQPRWTPTRADDLPLDYSSESQDRGAGKEREAGRDHGAGRQSQGVPRRVWLLFGGFSLLVLVGGWTASQAADVLAEQTGLGPAFLGATLLALATSLPEVSTTLAASRDGRYSMAISNIFGSNAFDVSLLFLAEMLYTGGTIMELATPPLVFVAAIGAVMTCIYLWGLMERENRTVLGVGWDSAAALAVYLGAMTVLYFMTSKGSSG